MKPPKIFGVQLKISPYLLVLMLIYIGLGVWPQALAVFILVFMHEWMHILVAKGYGVQVQAVELLPFGGVARMDGLFEVDPVVETWVAAAGPAANIFLALAGLVISQTGWIDDALVRFFIRANLSVATFNILPLLPLDGGRVWRAWLTGKKGYRLATKQVAKAGQAGGIILALAGIGCFIAHYTDFTPAIIGVFVFLAARKEEKEAQYVFLRYLNHKKEEIIKQGVLPAYVLTVRVDYPVKEVIRRILPQRFTIVHVIDDSFKLAGCLTETQIIEAMFEQGVDFPVGKVLQ